MLVKSIGLLVKRNATDEEYKVYLKKEQRVWAAFIIFGIFTLLFQLLFGNALINLVGEGTGNPQKDFLSGLYSGMGTGLVVAGVILIVRTKKVIKSDALRKKMRLEAQDERNRLIALRSLNAAGIIVIVAAYLGILVSGLINMTIFYTLIGIILLYCISFLIARYVYDCKM